MAFIRYDVALLIFLGELFIGSQGGYLFSFGLETGTNLSLRMGLFLAIFGAWAIRSALALIRRLKGQDDRGDLAWYWAMKRIGLIYPYLALLAAFGLAWVLGYARNGFSDAFFDANGYAFFGILPAVVAGFVGVIGGRKTFSRLVGLLAAAMTASAAKALLVFYIFSHRIQLAATYIYTWIRDTRVGEITIQSGDFYRVFFQAHLFALMAALMAALVYAYGRGTWRSPAKLKSLGMTVIAGTVLTLGLSRSFWFGLLFGSLTLLAALIWFKVEAIIYRRMITLALVGIIGGAAIIGGVYAIPFPTKNADFSFTSLLSDRATSLDDSAANSRWALLPKMHQAAMKHPILGSGFGTRVEYRTSDPRVLADSPTGLYSTYAFEWGYHDLWLKLGLVGLLAYGWLIYVLIRPTWALVWRSRRFFSSPERMSKTSDGGRVELVSLGLLAAAIALLATNIFSPYLNHPLGIIALSLLAAWNARRSVAANI